MNREEIKKIIEEKVTIQIALDWDKAGKEIAHFENNFNKWNLDWIYSEEEPEKFYDALDLFDKECEKRMKQNPLINHYNRQVIKDTIGWTWVELVDQYLTEPTSVDGSIKFTYDSENNIVTLMGKKVIWSGRNKKFKTVDGYHGSAEDYNAANTTRFINNTSNYLDRVSVLLEIFRNTSDPNSIKKITEEFGKMARRADEKMDEINEKIKRGKKRLLAKEVKA